jgi:ATP-dependent Clp protease ATP-binding subunit ClpA
MVASIPFVTFVQLFTVKEIEKYNAMKDNFVNLRTLKMENRKMVEEWFEIIYEQRLKHTPWWKIKELMKTPPLARDWSQGYTPKLDLYADNLTDSSFQLKIRRHVVTRESETAMIEQVLSSSNEANAILVGEEGVGRHTIIEMLSKKIYEGKTTNLLSYKRVLLLNMDKILSEYTDPQSRITFFEALLYEAAASKSVILVIDNFEKYCSSGDNHFDISSAIDKFAKTDLLQIIGITTSFSYEKYIYPNPKMRNVFARVDINEIGKDKAQYILMEKALDFEWRYKRVIPYETLLEIIEKSNFFITNIPFPEKSLQLLDDVCVYSSTLSDQEIITPDMVNTVLTNKTHIPTTLTAEIKEKLLHLEDLMTAKILGQKEAINELSSALRRSFLLIDKRKKPLATFLFLGPTGVGKTETAKVLTDVFFGSNEQLNRFDMSLFQSKSDIDKLIGSIEKLNPGLLTNAIRENPYGVLLLDEIEKSHPDILNIFLTIIDEGYFTDGYGQRVDCKNMVIIATSNAGAEHIHETLLRQSINKLSDDPLFSTSIIDYLVEKNLFSPEFLNRFDAVIAFKPIQGDTAITLAKSMVETMIKQIYDTYKVKVNITDETIKVITQDGYEKQFGARNLQRILRQKVEDNIAIKLLEGKVKEGDTINL